MANTKLKIYVNGNRASDWYTDVVPAIGTYMEIMYNLSLINATVISVVHHAPTTSKDYQHVSIYTKW